MAPPDDTPIASPALLSQAEAAEACGVSEATIRRARKAGRIPGVQTSPAGGYLIPVSSLITAGFTLDRVTRHPHASPFDTPHDTPRATPAPNHLTEQLEALRTRAEAAERRAAIAEAIAAERARSLEDMRTAMKALTASTAPPEQPTPAADETPHTITLEPLPTPQPPTSAWARFRRRLTGS